MSLRLEMLQVARLAPQLLGDSATQVVTFLQDQWNADGGARDRAGASDLYYTVFVLEGLLALQAEPPLEKAAAYLEGFGAGDDLDLVHVACLARCWASMPAGALAASTAAAVARNLERFRATDGGYGAEVGTERGTAYHGFLACGAHQDLGGDLGGECPEPSALAASVAGLRTADGGFANTPGLPVGSTTATAAAVTLLRQLQQPVAEEVGAWLLARAHPDGGYLAAPEAPMPDLLSTATALHALAGLQVDFSATVESCLDFVDTLWTGRAFCGHWADDVLDGEYTYYALLALGHLSL